MPEEHAPLEPLVAVSVLARELRRRMHELLSGEQWVHDANFRPPCMGVIACLDEAGTLSQREISDRLGLDASDVVGVLDILEAAALVERRRDPADRRRHAVVLTPAGQDAAARLATLRARVEEEGLAHLEPDERRALTVLVNKALGRTSGMAQGSEPARR